MEEVKRRQDRLAKLRSLKEHARAANDSSKQPVPATSSETFSSRDAVVPDPSQEPVVSDQFSFRTTDPLKKHLEEIKATSLGDDRSKAETLETLVKVIETEGKELDKQIASQEVDLSSLAPRKPGFDLARELCHRTERLERETQFSIAENIKERLRRDKDISAVGASREGEYNVDDDGDEDEALGL
ncbi:hypothetical protein DFJ73DRAFT_827646 [Zopfochytrium polystomum]|nr:hypothetical protein DFJ73DRAFT_827646 [Zopfochytrium polystomum]